MNGAFFLDRDGTIIEERGYICRLSQSEIFPFAYEAIRLMNESGFKVIGISNQSGVARGICTEEQVKTIHREITGALAKQGAIVDRFYYCPFHPEGVVPEYRQTSHLRKPAPGMILQAAKEFNIDLSQSYMIGDDPRDIETGKNAGCRTVLVLTGKGGETSELLEKKGIRPDLTAENILEAARMISK
ncbi:MAG: HAD family hydrolase [bacterium]|nr:HAD family hydrolase [bacterium]